MDSCRVRIKVIYWTIVTSLTSSGNVNSMVVLIPCDETHCHAKIDFRNWYKDRGINLADHLVNSEEAFIISYKGVS